MKTTFLSIVLLAAVSMSCKEIVNSPSTDGIMTGRVIPVDVDYTWMTDQYAGTTVSLKGTSFSAITDTLGKWTLKNVPAGIYTLLYAKPGFDTGGYSKHKYSGAGTDFVDDGYIIRMPTDSMVMDYVFVSDSLIDGTQYPYLFYGGHISSNKPQSYNIFCSLDTDSKQEPWTIRPWYVRNGKFSGAIPQVFDCSVSQWENITSGQKVFVSAQLLPNAGFVNFGQDIQGAIIPDYSNTMNIIVP